MKLLRINVFILNLAYNAAFAPKRLSFLPRYYDVSVQNSSRNLDSIRRAMSESSLQTKDSGSEKISENLSVQRQFENDGLFSWLVPYMDLFGFVEGRKMLGAIPLVPSGNDAPVNHNEAAERRNQAAVNFVNIDVEERELRDKLGNLFSVFTAVFAAWATLFGDDGSLGGHLLRFLTVIPLFLAFGYKQSSKSGVCNVAQKGLWDVDGKGLSKIEDPELAKALLKKVNEMNIETGLSAVVLSALFALLPRSSSVALILSVMGMATLYVYAVKTRNSRET